MKSFSRGAAQAYFLGRPKSGAVARALQDLAELRIGLAGRASVLDCGGKRLIRRPVAPQPWRSRKRRMRGIVVEPRTPKEVPSSVRSEIAGVGQRRPRRQAHPAPLLSKTAFGFPTINAKAPQTRAFCIGRHLHAKMINPFSKDKNQSENPNETEHLTVQKCLFWTAAGLLHFRLIYAGTTKEYSTQEPAAKPGGAMYKRKRRGPNGRHRIGMRY